LKRSELIALIESENPWLAGSEGEKIVDAFFDQIGVALAGGGRAELRGFGSFSTRSFGARTARNPRSGARVDVNEKRRPFFKPSSVLAKQLRGGN
jgi:integration host factor subunit beta